MFAGMSLSSLIRQNREPSSWKLLTDSAKTTHDWARRPLFVASIGARLGDQYGWVRICTLTILASNSANAIFCHLTEKKADTPVQTVWKDAVILSWFGLFWPMETSWILWVQDTVARRIVQQWKYWRCNRSALRNQYTVGAQPSWSTNGYNQIDEFLKHALWRIQVNFIDAQIVLGLLLFEPLFSYSQHFDLLNRSRQI